MSHSFANSPLGAALSMFEQQPAASTVRASLDSIPLRAFAHSMFVDPASVARCLETFVRYLNIEGITFTGAEGDQTEFLNYTEAYLDLIVKADLPACASTQAAELNDFLRKHKAEPSFTDPIGGIGLATVSQMDLRWFTPGTHSTVRYLDTTYKAFVIDDPKHTCVYEADNYGERQYVIEIAAQSGDKLYLSSVPDDVDAPTSPMDLADRVHTLWTAEWFVTEKDADGVKVPEVAFRTQTNMDWLLGLTANIPGHEPLRVIKASQGCVALFDRNGAAAQTTTTMVMGKSAPELKFPFTLGGRFYAWMVAAPNGENTDDTEADLLLNLAYLDLRDVGVHADA